MNSEDMAALRKPFEPSQIGKKPQVTCGACTAATKQARTASEKHCQQHTVVRCPTCNAYITTGHMHLDFVGHAVTTSRLLSVDPSWTWEPMGFDPQGLPATDQGGNLWIWLTICGVRKPGVGDGASAKEAIGDAIRNAAMRFGVALDLWAKEDLEAPQETPQEAVQAPLAPVQQSPQLRAWVALKALHPTWDDARIRTEAEDVVSDVLAKHLAEVTPDEWDSLAEQWEKEKTS